MNLKTTVLFIKLLIVGSVAIAADADTDWLESGLPPLMDPAKPPPLEITSLSLKRNEFDQEILRATCRRNSTITTVPQYVKLVILPAKGGGYPVDIDSGIVISPFPPDSLNAIVNNLLNYRDEIPHGARVYLEMRTASVGNQHPPVRISKVFWAGSAPQLAEARKNGPPRPWGQGTSTAPQTVALPADTVIPSGFTLKYLLGDTWTHATVMEDSPAGSKIKLLMFLVKPGKLYKPWQADAARKDVRVEADALAELRSNSGYFSERGTALRQRLARTEAPTQLESAAGKSLEVGQRLILAHHGFLDEAVVVSPPKAGVVRVRSSFERRDLDKQLIHLYLDPEPAPPPEAVAQSTPGSPPANPGADLSSKPPAVDRDGLVPIPANAKFKPGDRLKAEWAGQWHEVEVLEALADGRLKIRWVGWGNGWDEVRDRNTLLRSPDQIASRRGDKKGQKGDDEESDPADGTFPFRTWTDNTGKSKIEAQLISVDGKAVRLKRRDGKEVRVPLSRLSDEDLDYVKANSTESPFEQ